MGVKQAVAKQDEIPWNDLVPADLHQLALLHQFSPGTDEFKVAQPGLEVEKSLETFLNDILLTVINISGIDTSTSLTRVH